MDVSRREFVFVLAAAPAARLTFAQGGAKRSIEAERRTIQAARLTFAQGEAERRTMEAARRRAVIVERRVYDHAGVVPSASVLRRCGMDRFHRHYEFQSGTLKSGTSKSVTFLMFFASPEERARAWDRFNTDPEWCRLRESGPVRLQEISFPPLNNDN